MSAIDRFARKALLRRLHSLREGRVTLVEGGRSEAFGPGGGDLAAMLEVRDPRFFRRVALGGHLGAAEAFLDGLWTSDDLTALVRILLRNRDVMQGLEGGLARLAAPARALLHALRRNTPSGSRRNIAAHYDLGNDFFRLFLDETWMYSCAIFERPEATLREASESKNERICRKLALTPRDHLLEIGTGWGGFAIHAAGHFGCRVTTTTISREQHALARERIAAAGLADRVTLLLEDYRDLKGTFDKIVSIEMIEAVGHHYYDEFFGACARLTRPDAAMLLQAIVIDDRHYEEARREVDFIKRYIFPGSCIPSIPVLLRALARTGDFRLVNLEDLTPHYATTLRRWRENLAANAASARALGCSEEFLRAWDFYFHYCEGGFLERHIGDVQMLLARPRCPLPPLLPPLPPAGGTS